MNKTRGKTHPDAYPINPPEPPNNAWRILQITAEFVDGYERLHHVRPAVTVFGSARLDEQNIQYQAAVDIGKKLSDLGYAIITGGGPGIMEAANVGASMGKSLSIGLNIDLPLQEPPNSNQDISLRYRFFFTRKAMLTKHSMAYIFMPGGFGTIDELFDILTLIQTKKKKPLPIILYNSQHWEGLVSWMKSTLVEAGTISQNDMSLFYVVDTAKEVIDIISQFNEGSSNFSTKPQKIDFY